MKKTQINVSPRVEFFLIKMAITPTAECGIRHLTEEEIAVEVGRRQQEIEAVRAKYGDHTGAVRQGIWDDGIQVHKGSLNTYELVDQLEAVGATFFDAYIRKEEDKKNKVMRDMTYVVFVRDGRTPLDRATPEAKSFVVDQLNGRAWLQAYIWDNAKTPNANMTFNLFGVVPSAPMVELVAEAPIEATEAS